MVRKVKKRSATAQLFHNLRYRAGEYTLRGFIAALPWFPRRTLIAFTSLCVWISFALLSKYRKRMKENLKRALGKELRSENQIKEIVWGAWKNFAQGILETASAMHMSPEQISAMVQIEGEENLRRAMAKGKGVLALSAHLGNFTLIGARLATSGYPFSVVVKQPPDERFARLIDRYRGHLGIGTICAKPRREAVRGILKCLRGQGVVLVIADEFKSGGVAVNFMGQRLAAPRGPATLALRTGAATVPMFLTRRPDGRLVLSIDSPIELMQCQDVEESVAANTALFTSCLETMVRRYPEQWNWLGFPQSSRVSRSDLAAVAVSVESKPVDSRTSS